MNILLDTHILLWAAAGELPQSSAVYIENMKNTLYFRLASIWEIVIKKAIGRSDFVVDTPSLYKNLINAGYEELYITSQHTLTIASLSALHKDPFDRILLAQPIYEGILLLTADEKIAQYPGTVIHIKLNVK